MPAHDLASRFRRALLYVVEALGEVGVTKLQKILYLADLEHFHTAGTTLTGARWVRYKHGPMAKALLPSTEIMDGHEVTVSVEAAGPYESRVYRVGDAPRFRPDLTSEERAALDQAIAVTRSLSATEAIRLAYNTAPMLFIQKLEEVKGGLLLDVEIPFDLAPDVVADAVTPTRQVDPEVLATFKRDELGRIEDLNDAMLSSGG